MKKYLKLCLVMITGLLMSCAGEGYYGPQGRGGWNHMMGHGGGYGGIFMWIILIVIAVVIIYFVVNQSKTTGNSTGESPTEILKKRYAKGEITKEEFDRLKREIES